MGIGPVQEQREDGGVREISVGKGDEAGDDFHLREGGFVRFSLLSRCTGEPGTRRRGTSFKHFIFYTEIAGDKYTHPMTLRLNTEAGKHRALKGETKLDN